MLVLCTPLQVKCYHIFKLKKKNKKVHSKSIFFIELIYIGKAFRELAHLLPSVV